MKKVMVLVCFFFSLNTWAMDVLIEGESNDSLSCSIHAFTSAQYNVDAYNKSSKTHQAQLMIQHRASLAIKKGNGHVEYFFPVTVFDQNKYQSYVKVTKDAGCITESVEFVDSAQ